MFLILGQGYAKIEPMPHLVVVMVTATGFAANATEVQTRKEKA